MFEGFVSCVRHAAAASENTYYVVCKDKKGIQLRECRSGVVLHVGEEVEAETDGTRISSAIIKENGGSREFYVESASQRAAELLIKRKYSDGNPIERITARMDSSLASAARLFLRKMLFGAPIIIRFHNDADGASGAYGLLKAIQCVNPSIAISGFPPVSWKMKRGVAYSANDAWEDILTSNNFESVEKPLLFIVDFGTSSESNPGIAAAREKFDIIWLDHHPLLNEFDGKELGHYINPWSFGGDSSYTAGMLACEFAKLFADIDFSEMENASMVGDYSEYSNNDEESRKLALLLDMLTSDKRVAINSSNQDINPNEIDQILNDKQKRLELTNYALTRLEEAIYLGINSIKRYKIPLANVYVLDFENVRANDSTIKYPLPGRYASKLLERLETMSDKPCILILHFGYFISIRVDKKLDESIDLSKIVSEMKSSYKEIEGAGGHRNAMSIKITPSANNRELINIILRELGCDIR